jgi:hypothetical protein
MKYILSLVLLCSFVTLKAQPKTVDGQPYVNTTFVIILSTKSYSEAKKLATEAADKLKTKLDLRGLKPNKKSGLTMSPKECKEGDWIYPAYIARGRMNNGDYVSIEYSGAFKGFKGGYYIVVAASGEPADVKPLFAKVKKVYGEAYSKQTDVYMGCMH